MDQVYIFDPKTLEERPDLKRVIGFKYWNANGMSVCIVATQSRHEWAAYIGAQPDASYAEVAEWTMQWGCKILEPLAKAAFPWQSEGLVYRD